ncbi:MAG: hypothetical protein LBH04_11115 [Tannerellaceae bacterium]|jgi:hypothetical protein|nr:hypothetical protein [Tannerellaceae bacterium]
MKKRILLPLLFCGITVLLTSVSVLPGSQYSPVFMEYADLERSVSYKPGAHPLTNPGKIYYKSPYIFINERYKGVHIINNSVPSAPVNEGFVAVPGCIDIAVKENTLYVDNAVDLVAFDLLTKQVSSRIKQVFPELLSPDGLAYYHNDTKIIVEWKKR